MIPRLTSKESMLLLLHTFFLISRTYLSLVVARLDGEIVRDLVAGNGRAFSWGIIKWLGIGGPAVYCNAMVSSPLVIWLARSFLTMIVVLDKIPPIKDLHSLPHALDTVYP
jgi:hypothetical protein